MEKTIVPTEQSLGRRCGSCQFFGVLPNGTCVCRFDPPKSTAIAVGGPDGKLQWHTVATYPGIDPKSDWCGKWALRQQEAQA